MITPITGCIVQFLVGTISDHYELRFGRRKFFMVVGIAASPALLKIMNTAPELMKDSIIYLQIYFAGSIFIFI